MKDKELLTLLDKEFSHIKIDKHFIKRMINYRQNWLTKSEDRTLFIGGTLLGVYKVYFSLSDNTSFFSDYLDIDMTELQDKIHKLKGINKSWLISSDAFNITCLYLMHRVRIDRSISNKVKENGILNIYLIFGYRALAILHSNYFKYPLSKEVSEYVYAHMSGRFLIKRVGSWQKVLEHRSKDVVYERGLHSKTLITFYTKDVVETINDLQGRLRGMIKNIYREILKVKENNDKIQNSTQHSTTLEGDSTLKDLNTNNDNITKFMTILNNKDTLIKEDVLSLTKGFMPTTPIDQLRTFLIWITSPDRNEKEIRLINDLVENMLALMIQYLETKDINMKDKTMIEDGIVAVKGFWLSSRSTDIKLTKVRDIGNKLVTKAIKNKKETMISSVRNSFALYIFIRSI